MKVNSIGSLFAVICGFLVMFSWSAFEAQAQGPGGRMGFRGMGGGMGFGGMGGGMGISRLLGIEQVQKEINVTEEQKAKLEKMREESRRPRRNRDEMRKMREEMQNMSQEERRKKMEEMMQKYREESEKRSKETMKKLSEILKKEQLIRVKQIQMQMEGVGVLRRPEVMDHLGLDDAQKEQLKKIGEDVREQMQSLMRPPRNRRGDDENGSQNREQWRERMEKFRKDMENARKEIEKKTMDVLKPDQKKKLGEMMGEPFKLDRSAFQRRGGGPRERGRRGEGRPEGKGSKKRGGQNSTE